MQRDEINRVIIREEEEKAKIQNDLRVLQEKLNRINESLSRKVHTKQEYEKTLHETEQAYSKVSALSLAANALDFRIFTNIITRTQERKRQFD
jgi:Sjoegren syndrome nuclear autoantigen 1